MTAATPTAEEQHHDTGDAHHEHPPFLAHHFETPQQQFDSGKLGMWLFLVTEILFFSGLFVAYIIYRTNHPEIFQYAHHYLDWKMGAINTGVLILSSLTMAWAVRAAQLNQKKLLVWMLSATLAFAAMFLVIKYFEYAAKFEHGLYPGRYNVYYPIDADAVSAAAVEETEANPAEALEDYKTVGDLPADQQLSGHAEHGELHHDDHHHGPTGDAPVNTHIFFGIYFMMTGLHGVHIVAGMIAIGWLLFRSVRGDFSSQYFGPVDYVGLYWHLVDLIWIYLFPLLYLIH